MLTHTRRSRVRSAGRVLLTAVLGALLGTTLLIAPSSAAPSAVGAFQITVKGDAVWADGWAVDPSRPGDRIQVRFEDRTGGGNSYGGDFVAAGPRPELAQYGWGTEHGFAGYVHTYHTGTVTICMTMSNPMAQITYPQVICQTVEMADDPLNNDPRAAMTVSQVANGGVVVSGWAYDPNQGWPSNVAILLDGKPILNLRADRPSPEMAPYGLASNGFLAGFYLPSPGTHEVCVVALNVERGKDVLAQCNEVTWAAPQPTGAVRGDMGGYAAGSAIITQGWAFDEAYPSQTSRIMLTLDGQVKAFFYADKPSPELHPYGIGGNHGFTAGFYASPGKHQVCQFVVSINGRSALTKCIDVVTS